MFTMARKNKYTLFFSALLIVLYFSFNLYLFVSCFSADVSLSKNHNLQISIACIFFLLTTITFIQYLFFAELIYFYYVLYLLTNLCYFSFIFSSFPLVQQHIPQILRIAGHYISLPLLILSYFLYTQFGIQFLSIKTAHARLYRFLTLLSKLYMALLIICIGSFFLPGHSPAGNMVRTITLVCCMPMGLASIAYVYFALNSFTGRILVAGSLFFFAGSVLGFLFSSKLMETPANVFPFNTWYFYTECGTILEVIMFFSSFAYRNKVLAREENLAHLKLASIRDNIAKDLHDEIGSTLTSIKILSEISNKNLAASQQEKTSAFLQKISEQSAAVQQGISDIVWAVNPGNDAIETMIIRMREYVTHTLEVKNIQTYINIDPVVLQKTLGMEQRKNFFLIFKEAINNIAKYAQATEVNIRLSKHKNWIEMLIEDNGVGFDLALKCSGNGLRNMADRAQSLPGTLHIASSPGKGTNITLSILAT